MLDPFRPENPEDVQRLKELQTQIHDTFKDQVRSRRAGRLKDDPRLFTGEIWVGQRAVEMGLADGLGHMVPTMKARFGDDTRFATYKLKKPFLSRFGASLAAEAEASINERAAYARFGL